MGRLCTSETHLIVAIRNVSYAGSSVRIGFKVIVATSLVHLFPPKHHARAIPLLDEILSKSPDNIACLMGRAYILQEAKKWVEAEEVFARVSDLLPEDMDAGLRAKEERGWCLCNSEDAERGLAELREVLGTLQELEDRDIDSARCLWRLGKCQWDMGGKYLTFCGPHISYTINRRTPKGSLSLLHNFAEEGSILCTCICISWHLLFRIFVTSRSCSGVKVFPEGLRA